MNWTAWMSVAIGGMAGSVSRFGLSEWLMHRLGTAWPMGTFGVNMAGCFMLGVVYAFAVRHNAHENWRLLLGTGFCGGFTTFSAFSNEGYYMLKAGDYGLLAAYYGASIAGGILALAAGYAFTKSLL